MSRNSKNAQRIRKAKEISALHAKGEKGPAKTTPAHGKRKAWWQMFQSYTASLKGGKKSRDTQDAA